MKRSLFVALWALVCMPLAGYAQDKSMMAAEIWVEEEVFPDFPAFHSGAVAQHGGKWIFLGGRTNGMHGFYPPFAFPNNGKQNRIYVVDPDNGSVWSVPTDSLPVNTREQVTSSNMQFATHNGKLYLVGGYGYHGLIDDFTTFPYLTSVDLASLTDSVIAGGNPSPCFKTVTDSSMAVTGGRLGMVDDRFFLACGHYFHHRYSKEDLGSFIQRYTYQIRMFDIRDSAGVLAAENKTAVTDSVLFRRRDFNMTAFSEGPDGEGFIVWSGVFRDSVDLPHYRPIRIRANGTYQEIPLDQKLAHYQSGAMSLKGNNGASFPYSGKYLHFFFGGMAEYYLDSAEHVVQDSLVPFVKSFSSVQLGDGAPRENYFGPLGFAFDYDGQHSGRIRYAFNGFEGTNAEFLPNPQYLEDHVEVLSVDPQSSAPVKLGYLVGGIESTGRNIADLNDPSLSFASGKVYAVYYQMAIIGGIGESDLPKLRIYPNPATDLIRTETPEPAQGYEVTDLTGKPVLTRAAAANGLDVSVLPAGTYVLKVRTQANVYRSVFVKR